MNSDAHETTSTLDSLDSGSLCALSIAFAATLDGDCASRLLAAAHDSVTHKPDSDLCHQMLALLPARKRTTAPLTLSANDGRCTLEDDGSVTLDSKSDATLEVLAALSAQSSFALNLASCAGASYMQIGEALSLSSEEAAAAVRGATTQIRLLLGSGDVSVEPPCTVEPLVDRFIDGELDASPRAAVEQHIAKCSSCHQAIQFGKSLRQVLREGFHRALAESPKASTNTARHRSQVEIGDVIAGYRIVGFLGKGGMGAVYKATQLALDRPVAFKVLSPIMADNTVARARFLREARATARLDHPSIARTLDAGDENGVLYHAMEFVDGPNLSQELEHGPMAPRTALKILRGLAKGLAVANAHNIVHRDVKPANILIDRDDGQPKLTDLGLACWADDPGRVPITTADSFMGTPAYMSPEQIRDPRKVDCRSDLYALGVCFYEMLLGHTPFNGTTPMQVVGQVLIGNIQIPAQAQIPAAYAAVLLRLTRPNPMERYQDANELLEDLDAIEQNTPLIHAFSGNSRSQGVGTALRAALRWLVDHAHNRSAGRQVLAGLAVGLLISAACTTMWIFTSVDETPRTPNAVPKTVVRSEQATAVDADRPSRTGELPRGKIASEVILNHEQLATALKQGASRWLGGHVESTSGLAVTVGYDFANPEGEDGLRDFAFAGVWPTADAYPDDRAPGSDNHFAPEVGTERLGTETYRGMVVVGSRIAQWRPVCTSVHMEMVVKLTGENNAALTWCTPQGGAELVVLRHSYVPEQERDNPLLKAIAQWAGPKDAVLEPGSAGQYRVVQAADASPSKNSPAEDYEATWKTSGGRVAVEVTLRSLQHGTQLLEASNATISGDGGQFGICAPWSTLVVERVRIHAKLHPAWVRAQIDMDQAR